jgi:DNA-binding Xre family transcriptional regulator
MAVRNRVKTFIDGLGITRYQFWKETELAQNTAYRLYDDPTYIPGASVLNKICMTYQHEGVQPGDLLTFEPDVEKLKVAS